MTATTPDPRALKRTRGGRERLLHASAELFRSHTLSGTSLQMIADRLGVSKPAIYHHFRSRDDIVATLMAPVVADAEDAGARLRDLPRTERAAAARAFYADFVVRHRQVIAMVFFDRAALPGDLPAAVDRLADAVAGALAADLAEPDGPGAAATTGPGAPTDVGTVLVHGVAALVTRRQDLDDDALHARVTTALEALRPDRR